MSIEHDVIIQLIVTLGILFTLPWVFAAFKLFGRALAYYFFPINSITLEIVDEDGNTTITNVSVSDSSELAKSIIKAKRVIDHG